MKTAVRKTAAVLAMALLTQQAWAAMITFESRSASSDTVIFPKVGEGTSWASASPGIFTASTHGDIQPLFSTEISVVTTLTNWDGSTKVASTTGGSSLMRNYDGGIRGTSQMSPSEIVDFAGVTTLALDYVFSVLGRGASLYLERDQSTGGRVTMDLIDLTRGRSVYECPRQDLYGWDEISLRSGHRYQLSILDLFTTQGGGDPYNYFVVDFREGAVATPDPGSTFAMLGLGMLGVTILRRRVT